MKIKQQFATRNDCYRRNQAEMNKSPGSSWQSKMTATAGIRGKWERTRGSGTAAMPDTIKAPEG